MASAAAAAASAASAAAASAAASPTRHSVSAGSSSKPLQPLPFRLKLAALNELTRLGVALKAWTKDERTRLEARLQQLPSSGAHASFGVPLPFCTQQTGVEVEGLRVPRCMVQITEILRRHIGTEGLFRVSGSLARMREAQKAIDVGKDVAGMPHDTAGLLKQYLRDLPEPLLTFRLFEAFVKAQRLAVEAQRDEAILLLCLELPETHMHATRYLMHLLHDVVQSEGNLMTSYNISSIITPNILKPEESSGAGPTSAHELETHTTCVAVVERLIALWDRIGIPTPQLIQAASSLPDEDTCMKEYMKRVLGNDKPWWKRIVKPSSSSSKSLSSDDTLHLLQKAAIDYRVPASNPSSPSPK
eukprot:m.212866 g.212866  ORF g.212866 m.212866 type:complete len:359 (+) comp21811_c0_seq1:350-1426(+)